MTQTVFNRLTAVATHHVADQPLERFDVSGLEMIMARPRPEVAAPRGHQTVPSSAGDATDDLAFATWEDAEWR